MSFRDAVAAGKVGDRDGGVAAVGFNEAVWAASLKLWLDEISVRLGLEFSRRPGSR
jgi:hypothetical protein